MPSQAVWQQNGSAAHTVLQHSSSLQPRPPLAEQQSPSPGQPPPPPQIAQSAIASDAQMPSQAVWQQNGSAAHTVLQHSASLHPRPPFAEQQSPAFGLA